MKHSLLPLHVLSCLLCASVALAEPPRPAQTATQEAAAKLVQEKLLAPLADAGGKRKKFSRAAPPPVARRVHVTDAELLTDARGKHFVRFEIETRRVWDDEAAWETSSLAGCAYLDERQVFVKQGDDYVRVKRALGAYAAPQAGACVAAPATSDTLASAR